jgi:hypothetical protein
MPHYRTGSQDQANPPTSYAERLPRGICRIGASGERDPRRWLWRRPAREPGAHQIIA